MTAFSSISFWSCTITTLLFISQLFLRSLSSGAGGKVDSIFVISCFFFSKSLDKCFFNWVASILSFSTLSLALLEGSFI